MDALIQDVRSALRSLRRSPGFAVAAMLTLAVAVGANTAILSIADAVLFRPLPFADPDRVFLLQMVNPSTRQRFTLLPFDHVRAINERHRGLSEVGLQDNGPRITMTNEAGTTEVSSLSVSANYFDILGVRAARGRLFNAGDAVENARAAVLSHAAWSQRFARDAGVVGRSVQLGASSFDIVGILPRDFVFPGFDAVPELVTVLPPLRAGDKGGTFYSIVRLEPGVTQAQAQAETEAIVRALTPAAATPVSMPVLDDPRVVLFSRGQPVMWLLLAAALALLLIGCANLANIVLTRARTRGRDLAVRVALGASRGRLIRPIVFEALIVGLAAGSLAVLVTASTFDALARQVPTFVHRNVPVGVDARVFGFAMGLSMFGALVFSVFPAWHASQLDIRSQISAGAGRSGSTRTDGLGRPMIAVQVALAIVLVFGAAIAARAFVDVLRVPLGFTPENVIRILVQPPRGESDQQRFYMRAIESFARRGDVVSAGAAGATLMNTSPDDGVRGDPATRSREMKAGIVHVLPGYFETAGLKLIRGRFLSHDDIREGVDPAVVSEIAARVLFPGREAIGATLENSRGRKFVVVGVVGDVTHNVTVAGPPLAYVFSGADTRRLGMIVRMRERRDGALEEVRREVAALAPGMPIRIEWWADSIAAQNGYRNPRLQTLVLGTFAAIALGLTGLGVFAVVSFLVAMRTREMGIRIAIGATPPNVERVVLKQALVPVASGVVLGLLVAHWAKRLAEAQLFNVNTSDPTMLVAAVVTVAVAATAGAYLPARRAVRIDPIQALRAE
jgi:predicted permease